MLCTANLIGPEDSSTLLTKALTASSSLKSTADGVNAAVASFGGWVTPRSVDRKAACCKEFGERRAGGLARAGDEGGHL